MYICNNLYYSGTYTDSTSDSSLDPPSTTTESGSGSSSSQDGNLSSSGIRDSKLAEYVPLHIPGKSVTYHKLTYFYQIYICIYALHTFT